MCNSDYDGDDTTVIMVSAQFQNASRTLDSPSENFEFQTSSLNQQQSDVSDHFYLCF